MKIIIFSFILTFFVAHASELPCNCRLGNLNRIVKGKIATAHSIPWMVSLTNFVGNHYCGATILNENYVLTAAHCTDNREPEDIFVHVGLHDLKDIDIDIRRVNYGKNIIRGGFKEIGDEGDFALIELENPIKFVPGKVEPGCLNLKEQDFEGDLLAAGWGLTDRPWVDADKMFDEPNKSPKDTTELKYIFGTQVKSPCLEHDICLIAKNNNDSICKGDSGGPLMYTENGKTSVVGMASWLLSKEEGDKYFFCNGDGSFARISLYKDLIDQHAQNYCTV